MEQYNENQYDDDLTVGTDEYEDSYRTDAVDLFEFSAEEESPIGRLKGLILSIDWEITDEILMQFNEELIDLKDIWADEKINLVYVQALEKISKYIYQKKVNSHPNAIKLLLTLYYNLEKIVSSEDLSKQQKKDILLEDVKRFEGLKRQIANQDQEDNMPDDGKKRAKDSAYEETATGNELLGLKATVLGIDWEITEEDLGALRQEVIRLEEKYADNRPRLILLQGIGTLGAYIKVKRSNAHADAFKLLHLFFESLEKIVGKKMSLDEEKMILLPAVEKFNSFKSLLGSTISPDSIRSSQDHEKPVSPVAVSSGDIQPAFADIPDEVSAGFQEEVEAKGLGYGDSTDVSSHIDDFFGERSGGGTGSEFGDTTEVAPETGIFSEDVLSESPEVLSVDRELALQGVNVESDDDMDEDGKRLATGEESLTDEMLASERSDALEDDLSAPGLDMGDEELEIEFDDPPGTDFSVDKGLALQGVDVETEADDDSDEDALPVGDSGIIAPALDGNEEVSIFSADFLDEAIIDDDGGELSETLDGFFENEQEVTTQVEDETEEEKEDLAIISDVDQEETEESDEVFKQELTTELEDDYVLSEDEDFLKEFDVTDDLEEKYHVEEALADDDPEADFSNEIVEQHQDELQDFSDALEPALAKVDEDLEPNENDQFDVATVQEEPGFTGDDYELPDDGTEDITAGEVLDIEEQAAENLDEDVASAEIDSNLDAFFGLEDGVEEPDEADLLFSLPESGADIDEVETESLDSDIASEEVVFELANDEVDLEEDEPDKLAFAENDFLPDEAVLDQAELPVNVEDKVEAEVEPEDEPLADEAVDTEVEVEIPAEIAVAGDEVTEAVEELAQQSLNPLGILNECVESIGLEIDDKIIDGLYAEINHLRQLWATKSLEKSFLQLLSTVTQHIDQRRFDSSPEAYGLLQSAIGALHQLGEGTVEQNLDLLLSETSKVLQWQQDLLSESIDPEAVFDDGLTETADVDDEDDLSSYAVITDSIPEVDDILQEGQGEDDAEHLLLANEDNLVFHDDLRKEISSLRTTLQSEIAALRKDLKDS